MMAHHDRPPRAHRTPEPWHALYRRARERGFSVPDAELLRDLMRRAECWPDELAERLGWGPPATAVVRSHVADAVDDEGLLDVFARSPQLMRHVFSWLMNYEVTT